MRHSYESIFRNRSINLNLYLREREQFLNIRLTKNISSYVFPLYVSTSGDKIKNLSSRFIIKAEVHFNKPENFRKTFNHSQYCKRTSTSKHHLHLSKPETSKYLRSETKTPYLQN